MADQAPQTALMLDTNGDLKPVSMDNVANSAAQGWKLATPDQVKSFQLQQKYGSVGQQAITAAEGVASGATFGASRHLENAFGLATPETQRGRVEANPITAPVSEGVGALLPMLVPGAQEAAAGEEAGNLARIARFAPSNLVSRAGQAVEHAAAGALESGGPATFAQSIARNALAKGLGSGVEGLAYSAGQEVSENALGDPNQTAQSVIAHLGLGALFGGALGAGIGAGEVAIPTAVQRGKDLLADVYNQGKGKLGDFYGSELGSKFTGTAPEVARMMMENPAEIAEMEAAVPGLSKAIAKQSPETADLLMKNWRKVWTDPAERAGVLSDLQDGTQEMLDRGHEVMRHINKMADQESASLLVDADPKLANESFQKVTDAITEKIDAMSAKPDLYAKSVTAKLAEVRDGLVRDYFEGEQALTPADVFDRFRTLRKQLGKFAKYEKQLGGLPVADQEALGVVRGLYGTVKDALTNEDVFGQAAARRTALDDAQSAWLDLTGNKGAFTKEFTQNVAGKGGPVQKVKPKSINRMLNQMADARGGSAAETHEQFVDAYKTLVKEAEESFKTAPVGSFDKEGLESLVNKTGDMMQSAREHASITQLANQMSERGHPWGSNAIATGVNPQQAAHGMLGMLGLGAVAHSPALAVPLAAGKAILGAKDVSRTVATLAALERMGQKVSKAIDTGVAGIVKGGVRASYVARGEAAAGLAKEASKPYDTQAKNYQKNVARVMELSSDPGKLQAALAPITDHLHEHAPDTAVQMTAVAANAYAYLATKVPQHPKKGMLSANWVPTPTEIGRFNRHWEVAHNPLSVMKKIAVGNYMPEHHETLTTLYPGVHQQIVKGVMASLPKDVTKVPYRSRRALGLLMGTPVDGSFTPESIRANQAAFAMMPGVKQGAPAGGNGRVTQGGLGKLTLSGRFLTAQQASSQRGR